MRTVRVVATETASDGFSKADQPRQDGMSESIYIRTGHWASRPLPPDAPARVEGKLTTLSEVPAWSDFEVFESGSWQSAMRVDPPVVMRFVVEVEVESSMDRKEAQSKVLNSLLGTEDFRRVTVKAEGV